MAVVFLSLLDTITNLIGGEIFLLTAEVLPSIKEVNNRGQTINDIDKCSLSY